MAKIKNYTEAINELQTILDDLKGEDVAIDHLAAKVKRANELLDYCKEVLRKTEKEIIV